jgi:hypothetical protein
MRGKTGVLLAVLLAVITVVVVSCGGGGGSSTPSNNGTNTTTYSISGVVTSSGAGLQGVTMTLNTGDTATTDASGNYSFTSLVNGSYTLSPGKTGYIFSPTSSAQTVSGSNITGVAFTATANTAPTYSISGTVTSSGTALPGVTMTLSGAGSATVTTDASGNYSFVGLINGSYTVTPSMTSYTFLPANSAQTISNANITGINFTATAIVASADISGYWKLAANRNPSIDCHITQSGNTISMNYACDPSVWVSNGTITGNDVILTQSYCSSSTLTYTGTLNNSQMSGIVTLGTSTLAWTATQITQPSCEIISVPTGTITVDGNTADWAGMSPIITNTPIGTSSISGSQISKVYLAKNSQKVFVRLDLANGTPENILNFIITWFLLKLSG